MTAYEVYLQADAILRTDSPATVKVLKLEALKPQAEKYPKGHLVAEAIGHMQHRLYWDGQLRRRTKVS